VSQAASLSFDPSTSSGQAQLRMTQRAFTKNPPRSIKKTSRSQAPLGWSDTAKGKGGARGGGNRGSINSPQVGFQKKLVPKCGPHGSNVMRSIKKLSRSAGWLREIVGIHTKQSVPKRGLRGFYAKHPKNNPWRRQAPPVWSHTSQGKGGSWRKNRRFVLHVKNNPSRSAGCRRWVPALERYR
jgi:hypothetical protein